MTDKDIFRAEVEKVKVIIQQNRAQGAFSEGYLIGQESVLEHFENFVNSMQEEPASEDMWEASKQYALRQVLASTDTEMSEQAYLDLRLFSGFELAVAHKDGAKWQKELLMAKAVDGTFSTGELADGTPIDAIFNFDKVVRNKYEEGEKVKVLVIKED